MQECAGTGRSGAGTSALDPQHVATGTEVAATGALRVSGAVAYQLAEAPQVDIATTDDDTDATTRNGYAAMAGACDPKTSGGLDDHLHA